MASNVARARKRTLTEEMQVAGHELVEKVKGLLEEGRVRHIRVKSPTGELYFELPVSVGMIGGAALAFASPWLAMAGSLAGIAASVKVEIVRDHDDVIAVVQPLIGQSKRSKPSMHMEGGVNPGSLAMESGGMAGSARRVAGKLAAAVKKPARAAAKKASARKVAGRMPATAAAPKRTAPARGSAARKPTASKKKPSGRR